MHRTKSESGFTLIELVIVIVILGILAAVAIPKYEDMREQARVATIKGQLGAIRSAVAIQYARNALNGHGGFPPLDGTIFAEGRVPDHADANLRTERHKHEGARRCLDALWEQVVVGLIERDGQQYGHASRCGGDRRRFLLLQVCKQALQRGLPRGARRISSRHYYRRFGRH